MFAELLHNPRMAALYFCTAALHSRRRRRPPVLPNGPHQSTANRLSGRPISLFGKSRSLPVMSASVATTLPFGVHSTLRYGPLPYGPPIDPIGGQLKRPLDRDARPAMAAATKPTADANRTHPILIEQAIAQHREAGAGGNPQRRRRPALWRPARSPAASTVGRASARRHQLGR